MRVPKIGEPPTVITAIFIGTHGSLGYRRGQSYNLWLWRTRTFPVMIARMDNTGRCPYSSEAAFLRNWEIVDAEVD